MSQFMKSLSLTIITALCVSFSHADEEKFSKEHDDATQLIVDKKYDKAEKALRSLRKKLSNDTTLWAMTSYNLGLNLRFADKHEESIVVFKEILDSNVNDRDPGASIMEHFRNYRHKSCFEISHSYEALGNYDMALKYMELAKDKYVFHDLCGTCFESAEKRLADRVEYLKEEQKKKSTS